MGRMCLSIGNFYLKSLNRPTRHHPFKYINNPPPAYTRKIPPLSRYKPRALSNTSYYGNCSIFKKKSFQIVTYLIRICSGFYIVKLILLTFADYTPHSVHNLGGICRRIATNVSLLTIKYNNNKINMNPATKVNLNSIK